MHKVFVIDDDVAVCESIALLLEVHGMEVECFSSTAAFITRAPSLEGACLVLDHDLPRQTGLEFLESSFGRNLDIPVIMITGRGEKGVRERALRNGVAAFLEKPLATDELVKTIESLSPG